VTADDKEEPALAAVMERLRHEGEGILLIYDNAIDAGSIEPYLPRGGVARVLVTSNAPAWRHVADAVEIHLWPKDIGTDYLLVRTGRGDQRGAAEALTEALGGLPLAHEQAAAYCERLHVSLGEYTKRLKAAPVRLLGEERYAAVAYGLTVAKTFALAIEESAKIHPAAEPLIVHAAQLAPEPIPLFLFSAAPEKFGEPLAAALAGDGLDEAVAALSDFALVSRDTVPCGRDPSSTASVIRLHRLVREIAAERRNGAALEASRRALVGALGKSYPENSRNDPGVWPRCALLMPHVLTLCEPGSTTDKEGRQVARLLDRAGGYLGGRGDYAGAQILLERALEIRETLVGREHLVTSESLSHLGNLLQEKGDLPRARHLHERALAIREKARGSEDRVTAESLNNLAVVLNRQGDFAAARQLCERALAIREKVLGPEGSATANSLGLLSRILQAQGNLVEAQPLCERALAIHEKLFGPEDPTTAMDLDALAFLLRARGDLAGARHLFERALVAREKVLGPEHPRTAASLTNLALLLSQQGDAAAAGLYERALAIREKVLGPHHADTVGTRNKLSSLMNTS
jgi:tetratricopeptide (TPR) repeat protein